MRVIAGVHELDMVRTNISVAFSHISLSVGLVMGEARWFIEARREEMWGNGEMSFVDGKMP